MLIFVFDESELASQNQCGFIHEGVCIEFNPELDMSDKLGGEYANDCAHAENT